MNKRITSILLAVLMVMSTLVTVVPTYAAGGAPNVTFEIDAASEINPGDTFTVTITSINMAVNSFACGIAFDGEKLEWVSTVSGTDIGTEDYDPEYYGLKKVNGSNKNGWYTELMTSSAAEIVANNAIGFTAGAGSSDIEYHAGTIAIITFRAKDVTGVAEITIYESSASDDAKTGDGYDGKDGFETKTVTITEDESDSECDHVDTGRTLTYIYNGDGTHTVKVTCDCGAELADETAVDECWDDPNDDLDHQCNGCDNNNVHTGVEVYEEEATCSASGHKAYYECSCGYFEDAECTKEITDIEAWLNGEGKITAEHRYAWDCSTTCDFCREETRPEAKHAYDLDCSQTCIYCSERTRPEADHKDENEDHYCDYENCGEKVSNCSGHEKIDGNYATCLEDGWKDCWKCYCGVYYEDSDCTIVIANYDEWTRGAGKIAGGHDWRESDYVDNGDGTHTAHYTCANGCTNSDNPAAHEYENGVCICGANEPTSAYSGWTELDGNWFYFDPETNKAVTGAVRVPYPTAAINGITYAPNAADVAYAADNPDSKYTDATTAIFVFDEKGIFTPVTGMIGSSYAVNGMIGWHVGLVQIGDCYYYFKGDESGNGNVMVVGNVYASRNTTGLAIVIGGIYTFGTDGKMCMYDGITNVNGTLYYYESNRLAIDAGLVEIDGAYYYVCTSGVKAGQLIVNRDYWVVNTNGKLAVGMYTFAADGKIVIDTVDDSKEGIVNIDGDYYYYVGGVKQVSAGVLEMTDELGETYYIYVRANGKLATGTYWPANCNGLLEIGPYNWGTDGKYYPSK